METRQEKRRKARQSDNPPPKENISTVEAIKRLYSLTSVIMCNSCEKKDTCVNRNVCILYSDKPPNCLVCGEVLDKNAKSGLFFCTPCMVKEAKEKRMEEIESKPSYMDPPEHERERL